MSREELWRFLLYVLARSVRKYCWRSGLPLKVDSPPLVNDEPKQFDDENWLDLRRLDVIAPIMLERLDIMAAKGCDAVEWDNADVYVHEVTVEGRTFPLRLSVYMIVRPTRFKLAAPQRKAHV